MIPLSVYLELISAPEKKGRGPYKICHASREAKKQAEPRRLSMAFMYKQGKTLQEIGDAYGITRERVRQLIKALGLSGKDGGIRVSSGKKVSSKKAATLKRKNIHTQKYYGCDYGLAVKLNDGKQLSTPNSLARNYIEQRRNAISIRDVGWDISFPEWADVWVESGLLDKRGRGKGKFVMGRIKDQGPYHRLNVYICPFEQNVGDYQNELKVSGIRCADGFKRLPERIEKLLNKEEQAA